MRVENRELLVKELTRYIQDHLLDGDQSVGLTADTPLLEWGILNSIETARLVGFIREQFGIRVPPAEMVSRHFKNIECIADLVSSLSESGAEPKAPGSVNGGQGVR